MHLVGLGGQSGAGGGARHTRSSAHSGVLAPPAPSVPRRDKDLDASGESVCSLPAQISPQRQPPRACTNPGRPPLPQLTASAWHLRFGAYLCMIRRDLLRGDICGSRMRSLHPIWSRTIPCADAYALSGATDHFLGAGCRLRRAASAGWRVRALRHSVSWPEPPCCCPSGRCQMRRPRQRRTPARRSGKQEGGAAGLHRCRRCCSAPVSVLRAGFTYTAARGPARG